ncbi:hypothetical protein [Undibacterium fentianense]|uniref:Uncharacterized protein n=1 Tax=Undibacterium fentianense TaxID=2828728 RepID=A0A941IDJ4_9BURK|nr:hypothetical protein [Undibacterium fentianense]MBR7800028.1 hypothetical protein [Undibacterium fentianense]
MNPKHRYLPLAQISPGAILADDLLDKLGHVLLPSGTKLTESILRSIANHEIQQLYIFNEIPTTDSGLNEEGSHAKAQLERIDFIFRHLPQDSPSATLKTYIQRYRTGETV